MDDLLEDSNHLQAALCKEAVETSANQVPQGQASLRFAFPIRVVVYIDLLPTLRPALLPEDNI